MSRAHVFFLYTHVFMLIFSYRSPAFENSLTFRNLARFRRGTRIGRLRLSELAWLREITLFIYVHIYTNVSPMRPAPYMLAFWVCGARFCSSKCLYVCWLAEHRARYKWHLVPHTARRGKPNCDVTVLIGLFIRAETVINQIVL